MDSRVEAILAVVDPRLAPSIRDALARPRGTVESAFDPLPRDSNVVLVGHRAAGKTTMLPAVASLAGRIGYDLDAVIAQRTGEPVRTLVERDVAAFRRHERDTFTTLPTRSVIAVGGGFLSHHPDLLAGHVAVLIPVTLETYRQRLSADTTRPRLQPSLSLDDELATIFAQREALHARVPTVSLADWLLRVGQSGP